MALRLPKQVTWGVLPTPAAEASYHHIWRFCPFESNSHIFLQHPLCVTDVVPLFLCVFCNMRKSVTEPRRKQVVPSKGQQEVLPDTTLYTRRHGYVWAPGGNSYHFTSGTVSKIQIQFFPKYKYIPEGDMIFRNSGKKQRKNKLFCSLIKSK